MRNLLRNRLRDVGAEVTREGYGARARQRRARRKSVWNLLDLPGLLAGFGLSVWMLLHLVFALRNLVLQQTIPVSRFTHSQDLGVAGTILVIGLLIAAVPLGMLISNSILWCVPPYRRACTREAKGVWHASFIDAQKDLSLFALCIGLPSLLASFVAAFFVGV
jgi:hypothetical protein